MRILFLLFIFASCSASKKTSEPLRMFSREVKDTFAINFRYPENFSPDRSYHLIFIADGSLKLGNYFLGTDSAWGANIPPDCVFITIAHEGDYDEKRRRDFIPSDAGGYNDENFGQARNFYLFLKNTLLPSVMANFAQPLSTSFVGHSFSGLFCLYTLFQEDKLFDNHFAISPSVWANDEELMKIEDAFFRDGNHLSANVQLQAGGLEFLNMVLSSTNKFYETTRERKYKNYQVAYSQVNNANHYSIIKPGADKVLLNFR